MRMESGTRLFCEGQGSEMLGHMIGIPVDYACGLPAHEVAPAIGAQTVDAVQVRPPLRSRFHGLLADGLQWHARRGIPDMRLFINTPLPLPSGLPFGVVAFLVQVNGEIHPVAGGRNLELAIVLDTA